MQVLGVDPVIWYILNLFQQSGIGRSVVVVVSYILYICYTVIMVGTVIFRLTLVGHSIVKFKGYGYFMTHG